MVLSIQQKIWLVQNFNTTRGFTQLRRDFIRHFNISNKKNVPSRSSLRKVVQKFSATGSVGDARTKNQRPNIDQEKVTLIKNHFEENPKTSLRRASYDLHIPKSSIHKTLKHTLKFKPI